MWKNEALPIVEDCVEYHIYDKSEDENLTLKCSSYNSFVADLTKNHIWQDEPFLLTLSTKDHSIPHIFGATRFGDNIEDEWFIVYLLFELSKKYPTLIISMKDSDGEFLLIEASLSIPKWLTPENSDNRVWLCNGVFHIIPKARTPLELLVLPTENVISLEKALQILKKNQIDTKVGPKIQEAIQSRFLKGLQSTKESTHVAYCYLPRSIGFILTKFPQLIGHAVRYYYHRDSIQMRACKNLSKFKDIDPVVLTPVTFTRLLYAQLLRQPLDLLPRGLKEIPPSSEVIENKRYALGYKILCGFEILYKDLSQRKKRAETKPNSEDYHTDLLYLINSVFDSNAYESFVPSQSVPSSSEEWLTLSPDEVNDIISEKQQELDAYLQKKKKKENPEDDNNNDNNNTKNNKNQKNDNGDEDSVDEENGENPIDKLASCVKEFVKNSSNFEGIKNNGTKSQKKDAQGSESSSEDESDEFYRMGEDSDEEEIDGDILELMKQMDKDLENTCLNQSFEKKSDNGEGDDDVDVDFNLIKNFLSSYSEQHGMAGPVSNLFGHLNIGNNRSK
jgi:hypothetical protein